VPGGDAGLRQVITGPGENTGGAAVGLVFGQRSCDEADGALHLPAGEQVRPVAPVLEHAGPYLVRPGQPGPRPVHLGQVRGPAVNQDEQHAQD